MNLDKRNIATANRRNSTAAHRKRSLDRDSESGSAKNARAVKSEPKRFLISSIKMVFRFFDFFTRI